jgi:proteasome lid subunit RPN8/RPN11
MIEIPQELIQKIIRQAHNEAPLEACGYLGGAGNVVKVIYPMTNADHSPEHYSFDPEEQFKVLRETQDEGLDLIAVYHTHPATPPRMSAEDIRLAYDTSVLYVIYSIQTATLKAFKVNDEGEVHEVSVHVTDTARPDG